jgi:hypothetical protein
MGGRFQNAATSAEIDRVDQKKEEKVSGWSLINLF